MTHNAPNLSSHSQFLSYPYNWLSLQCGLDRKDPRLLIYIYTNSECYYPALKLNFCDTGEYINTSIWGPGIPTRVYGTCNAVQEKRLNCNMVTAIEVLNFEVSSTNMNCLCYVILFENVTFLYKTKKLILWLHWCHWIFIQSLNYVIYI